MRPDVRPLLLLFISFAIVLAIRLSQRCGLHGLVRFPISASGRQMSSRSLARSARACGLIRQERTSLRPAPGRCFPRRDELVREVRYRSELTGAVVRMDPEEVVKLSRAARPRSRVFEFQRSSCLRQPRPSSATTSSINIFQLMFVRALVSTGPPVAVARRVGAIFSALGARKILDVGSGPGKFCIVAGSTCQSSSSGASSTAQG